MAGAGNGAKPQMEVFWPVFNRLEDGSWVENVHENIDLTRNRRNRPDGINEISPVALHGGIWHRIARRRASRPPILCDAGVAQG